MEAYVDDMIVKSKQGESHARQLEKVFTVFRKNNMRLNPDKCAFGVKSEKFLGYMITHRGIEANPEKVQAVIDMESPTSMKKVQSLTGRLTALGRFLSKYAERSLPFFKALKGGKNFQWTPECEKAFQELKEYLKEIPLLTRPETGEKLYLYLGVSHQAVSAVLVRQVGQVDSPVYYVSKVLQGEEMQYPYAEKIALALVAAARKLRPYFQAHAVAVLTDQPLRQILQKPECSGRLTKWAIELNEYDISFEPRKAIKGQALADFIVECTHPPATEETRNNEWMLFVDGASNAKGSGAGVVLISPEQEILEYSIHFTFPNTNNVAEYEALLAGMTLAERLEFQGTYEVREPVLARYLQKVKEIAHRFEHFELIQINRSLNQHADALSKLASARDTPGRLIHMEVLQQPSVGEEDIAVHCITEIEDWRSPILKYLLGQELPKLYKRGYSIPLLKCLGPREAQQALEEVHEGDCGEHLEGRALVGKILRASFFWPTIRQDAAKKVRTCDKCQKHAPLTVKPPTPIQLIFQPLPFAQWGLDILGPFPMASAQRKFLLVATDYFTKWVEAEPLATITEKKVEGMVWKDIICRFGMPHILNTDHGTQFDLDAFRAFCHRWGISLRMASIAYPQANG
ncbi:uncharacterized protein LOC127799739 [Diospyros lotus]|uniref:uncharacterized protein LOC127799739 n=1 Tax=Diospyros lotus TaxID=55363 RepID=UPI00225AD1A8|nr:uncharacterized protein LOC127799739 [Diospyros lotus]